MRQRLPRSLIEDLLYCTYAVYSTIPGTTVRYHLPTDIQSGTMANCYFVAAWLELGEMAEFAGKPSRQAHVTGYDNATILVE